MKRFLKALYKIFRISVMTAATFVIMALVTVYIALSLPFVQEWGKGIAEKELSKALDTKVTIGNLSFVPFNNAALDDVTILDAKGDTAMYVERIAAGIDLYKLTKDQRISISHAVLRGVDARIYRDSLGAPLNIQNIIAALQPKDKNTPPTLFDLEAHTIVIRQWSVTYDVNSEPLLASGFDKNHIKVENFRADLQMPLIKNDDFEIDLRRLALDIQNGITISEISGYFHISDKGSSVENMVLRLPQSSINISSLNTEYDGWGSFKSRLNTIKVNLSIDNSEVVPSDFAAFMPILEEYHSAVSINVNIDGSTDSLNINRLNIGSPGQLLDFKIAGNLSNLSQKDSIQINIPNFGLNAGTERLIPLAESLAKLSPRLRRRLEIMDTIAISGSISGSDLNAKTSLRALVRQGSVNINANYTTDKNGRQIITAKANTNRINLGRLIGNPQIGDLAASINGKAVLQGSYRNIAIDSDIKSFTFRGHTYNGIDIKSTLKGEELTADAALHDSCGSVIIKGVGSINKHEPWIKANASIIDVDLAGLNLLDKYPGYKLNTNCEIDIAGKSIETATGYINLSDISFTHPTETSLKFERFRVDAYGDLSPRQLVLTSDFIDCQLTGEYDFATIVPQFKEILSHTFPVFVKSKHPDHLRGEPMELASRSGRDNQFAFDIDIKRNDSVTKFTRLPIALLDTLTIDGSFNNISQSVTARIRSKFLQQKDKLIKGNAIDITIDGTNDTSLLRLATTVPTKEGPMPLTIRLAGEDNRINSKLNWHIDRKELYEGEISVSTLFDRDTEDKIIADITFDESEITFNDSVWTIHKSNIFYRPEDISIDNFSAHRDNQHIKINGKATKDSTDIVNVELLDINLDYIFESLGLTNVMIGGDATGLITASGTFSGAPDLKTDNLFVENISYNKAVIGNALINSKWINDSLAVKIDADIYQPNEQKSRIFGYIFPLNDSLDMNFHINKANAGFLSPYIVAFAEDLEGECSGKVNLYGTFKDIDLKGDAYVDTVSMKIKMTGVRYGASDPIHFDPGRINLRNIKLYDNHQNSALLNGYITHKFFREPCFNLTVTADDKILAYDIAQNDSQDWYGHIFASGSTSIIGQPGLITITPKMTAQKNSSFTFVLEDRIDADAYDFITFRDIKNHKEKGKETKKEIYPKPYNQNYIKSDQISKPSDYEFNLDFSINNDIQMNLVMDPDGGDNVKAYGNGKVSMKYDSRLKDLEMTGTYVIDHGEYLFTLQNIIIKKFTIDAESSIKFNGDPYENTTLNINAKYKTKANLTDLDASFQNDKELRKTDLEVNAILYVNGNMKSPELSFDLAFPTLEHTDIDSKINSILSTEEMKAKQVFYLLAFTRFQAPSYMESTTNGSELVSVTSSTITSQINNIMGKFHDNLSITSNVRSDRGDFSDVRVDLGVSTSMLNNRLRLNGNFGYRDDEVTDTRFIGDFDFQYVLNRSGSLIVKGFHRYNDQNYYVRTAETTQGAALIYTRDFDNIFGFFRRKKKPTIPVPNDSIPADSIIPVDSIPLDSIPERELIK